MSLTIPHPDLIVWSGRLSGGREKPRGYRPALRRLRVLCHEYRRSKRRCARTRDEGSGAGRVPVRSYENLGDNTVAAQLLPKSWCPAAALRIFFWAPVSINIEKRCDHYRLIVACMLSGASRDRPVIVGWSTALRDQVINEKSRATPEETGSRPARAAKDRIITHPIGEKQGGPPHDHRAKLGQLRYTRSQYSFVVIALSSMKSIAPPSTKKELSALDGRQGSLLCPRPG